MILIVNWSYGMFIVECYEFYFVGEEIVNYDNVKKVILLFY